MDVVNAEQVCLFFYYRPAAVLWLFVSVRLASPKRPALAQSWLWSACPPISVLKVMCWISSCSCYLPPYLCDQVVLLVWYVIVLFCLADIPMLTFQSDPYMIKEIVDAVTIPVMAKVRIGHFVEAQVSCGKKNEWIISFSTRSCKLLEWIISTNLKFWHPLTRNTTSINIISRFPLFVAHETLARLSAAYPKVQLWFGLRVKQAQAMLLKLSVMDAP